MEPLKAITTPMLAYALVTLVFGYLIAKLSTRMLTKWVSKKLNQHQQMLFNKILFYTLATLFLFTALDQLGFDLAVLLGAAGVLSVGLSFAAKTSASNLISGVFLLVEHPFKVGDNIKYKNFTGKVETINLLSTLIRTSDNTQIRIPNEGLVKADIINNSRYKTRRLDILLTIDYSNEVDAIQQDLLTITQDHALTLEKPASLASINQLNAQSIELKLSCWCKTSDLGQLKNDLNYAYFTYINTQLKPLK